MNEDQLINRNIYIFSININVEYEIAMDMDQLKYSGAQFNK